MAVSYGAHAAASVANATSITTAAVSTTTGSTIVLFLWGDSGPTYTPSDSGGHTWTAIGSAVTDSAGSVCRAYYAKNITGSASHTFTSTTNSNASQGVWAVEVLNADTSAPLDTYSSADDTSSPFTAGSGFTNAQADEFLVSFIGSDTSSTFNPSESTGFTRANALNGSATLWGGASYYKILSAVAANNPSYTASGTSAGVVFLVGIKGAAAAGGSITPTGLATAAAFGTAVLANAAAQSLAPSGLATAEAPGSATVANVAAQALLPAGIATAEGIGTASISSGISLQELNPSSITTAAAFGTAVLANVSAQEITLTGGIATAVAFGTPALANATPQSILLASGIATAGGVSSATIANASEQSISVSGIAAAAAFGTDVLANVTAQSIALASGVSGAEAFGVANIHGLTQYILPLGVESGFAAGTAQIAVQSEAYNLTALLFSGITQPITQTLTAWHRNV